VPAGLTDRAALAAPCRRDWCFTSRPATISGCRIRPLYAANVEGTARLGGGDGRLPRIVYTSRSGAASAAAAGRQAGAGGRDGAAGLEEMANPYKRSKWLAERWPTFGRTGLPVVW